MILNDNKSSKGLEISVQTDLSLSDISRLEDMKTVLFDDKLRINMLISEAQSILDLKRNLNLFL